MRPSETETIDVNGMQVDVEVYFEGEQESYESVYGEPPDDPRTEFYYVCVKVSTVCDGHTFRGRDGVGFVDGGPTIASERHMREVAEECKANAIEDLKADLAKVASGIHLESAKSEQTAAINLLAKIRAKESVGN